MNILETLKKLVKSKTIIGIVTAAVGGIIEYGRSLLTPEVMAQYGDLLQVAAALLQTSGLGTAVYGRLTAKGPLVSIGEPK